MKYIPSFEQFINEKYNYIFESNEDLISMIDDLNDDIEDYTEGSTVNMSIVKKALEDSSDKSVKDYVKKEINDTTEQIKKETEYLNKAKSNSDKDSLQYHKATIDLLKAYLSVYAAVGKGNGKGILSAMKKVESLAKTIAKMDMNESYNYINIYSDSILNENKLLLTVASKNNKKQSLTSNQESEFNSNLKVGEANIKAAESFIKDLNAWNPSNEVEEELKDIYLGYAEAQLKGEQLYVASYKSAQSGNIKKTEKLIDDFKKVQKTYNKYYKETQKVLKANNMSNLPWSSDFKSIHSRQSDYLK
jgi:hypothetical protein